MKHPDDFEALCTLDTAESPGSLLKYLYTAVHLCSILYYALIFLLLAIMLLSQRMENSLNNFYIKKGDFSNVSNYRPISLLCILSKVLESIVRSKISSFGQLLISHQQFGFVEGLSTLNQLLKFLADIYHHTDNEHCTDIIYFDFKTTFDTVAQQVVIQALDTGD